MFELHAQKGSFDYTLTADGWRLTGTPEAHYAAMSEEMPSDDWVERARDWNGFDAIYGKEV